MYPYSIINWEIKIINSKVFILSYLHIFFYKKLNNMFMVKKYVISPNINA